MTDKVRWWEEGIEEKWDADARIPPPPPDVVWKDGTGKRTPVADLDDVHIMNILRMYARITDEQIEWRIQKQGNRFRQITRNGGISFETRRAAVIALVPVFPYLEQEALRRGFTPPGVPDEDPGLGNWRNKVLGLGPGTQTGSVFTPIAEVLSDTQPAEQKQSRRGRAKKAAPTAPVETQRFALLFEEVDSADDDNEVLPPPAGRTWPKIEDGDDVMPVSSGSGRRPPWDDDSDPYDDGYDE